MFVQSRQKTRVLIAALTTIVLQALTGPLQLALAEPISSASRPAPAMPKSVRTGPKRASGPSNIGVLSANPTDTEIIMSAMFKEPLIPMTDTLDVDENRALGTALTIYRKEENPENVSALTQFLAEHPKSRWRASIEFDLGQRRFETGYLSEALTLWRSTWNATKGKTKRFQKGIADAAIAELVMLEARLGEKQQLTQDLAEVSTRSFTGTPELKIKQAKEGLWCMNTHPEHAYKCGPYALNSVLSAPSVFPKQNSFLAHARSSDKGTNLAQVANWAHQVGLKYQMAQRSKGSKIIVPSVMHWKLNHFAAITSFAKGRYQIKDPTFGENANLWITQNAIDAETDGYCLIPNGPLPPGYSTVADADAQNIWGKGSAEGTDQSKTPANPKICVDAHCCNGMARVSAFAMQGTLNIRDIPLTYTPPIGPRMDYLCNYNYLEGNQPSNQLYPNIGPDWSINWVAYLNEDASGNVTVSIPGGGYETYNYVLPDNVSNPYLPNLTSQAVLTRLGPLAFQRELPDGTIEIYNQVSNAGISLSEIIDPQGNAATVQFGGSGGRIASVTDALGQVTNFTYLSNLYPTEPAYWYITQITDPFGRSASFGFSTNLGLGGSTITDTVGITTSFNGTELDTPYGATTCIAYTPSAPQLTGTGLKFSFPDGTSAVVENWIDEACKTYFWDREAYGQYPNDATNHVYTHCDTTQWLLASTAGALIEAPVVDFHLPPLENKTTYTYAGETTDGDHNFIGGSNKPIQVSRVVSGTTTQTWNYQNNAFGQVTQSQDPVGRTFAYKYAANNVDLLEKRQIQGTNNDLNGKWEFNNLQHVPNTYIDGSGQKTQYTYNSFGELQTLTDANSDVWTLSYNTKGYLTQIQGPLAGTNDVTTLAYDGYGRLYTVTDSEGYTLTYSYDNLNRLTQITYPDGTSEQIVYQLLDPVLRRDRIGRWTKDSYDPMEQLISEIDPLNRQTLYSWCTCGSLATLTDPAGNVTTWQHDLEGRVTNKVYADTSQYQYGYDAVGPIEHAHRCAKPAQHIFLQSRQHTESSRIHKHSEPDVNCQSDI